MSPSDPYLVDGAELELLALLPQGDTSLLRASVSSSIDVGNLGRHSSDTGQDCFPNSGQKGQGLSQSLAIRFITG